MKVTHKRIYSLIIIFFLFIVSIIVFGNSFPKSSEVDIDGEATKVLGVDDLNVKLIIEDEEQILGPANNIDMRVLYVPIDGGFRVYMGNNTTDSYFTNDPDLSDLVYEGTALNAGTLGNFDECGAWLMGTHKITETNWIGWYHAEEECDYDLGITKQSIAYAESNDAGLTWTKPDYPNNQVITVNSSVIDTNLDDAGDFKIFTIDGYFYAYYRGGASFAQIARASITSDGVPGSWQKYYCSDIDNPNTCGFTEPGIGGQSTQPDSLGSTGISYNTFLNRYIAISTTAKWGFFLNYSEDQNFLEWSLDVRTLLPYTSFNNDPLSDNIFDRVDGGYIIPFPSIIGLDGSSTESGSEFYLYYVKIFPHEDLTQRYLFRRKLKFVQDANTDHYVYKATLNRYTNTSTNKEKYSIERGKDSEGYEFSSVFGYVLPYPDEGYRQIHECYDEVNEAYFLSSANPALSGWENCNYETDKFIRTIGFFSDNLTYVNDKAVYSCFDTTNSTYFLSSENNCLGESVISLLGYVGTTTQKPLCTSFTYGDWSICNNGTQTRTITSGSPESCVGGSPILSQSCIICDSFTYSDWGVCTNSSQTREVLSQSPANCVDGSPTLSQSCTICDSFTYSDWGTCTNGSQSRTIISKSPTNCSDGNPVLTRSCSSTVECTSFTYSTWGTCTNGSQSRSIISRSPSNCTGGNPVVNQSCNSTTECTSFTYSDWGVCINGVQSRTISAKSPTDCNDNNAVLTRSCTSTTAATNCSTISYSDWGNCNNGKQTRSILNSQPTGCIVSYTNVILEKSCIPTCTSVNLSQWSQCINGKQTRTVLSKTPLDCDSSGEQVIRNCQDIIAVSETESLDSNNYLLIGLIVGIIAIIGTIISIILFRKKKNL